VTHDQKEKKEGGGEGAFRGHGVLRKKDTKSVIRGRGK